VEEKRRITREDAERKLEETVSKLESMFKEHGMDYTNTPHADNSRRRIYEILKEEMNDHYIITDE